MKKKLLKTIPLLLMALAPLAMSAVNTIIHTASYDLSKITIGTDTLGGVTYNTVHYDGLYNDGAPGMPSLPVDYIRFSVPWNATNFTVSAALQNNLISSLSNLLLYPCQPYWLMDDTTHHNIVLPDNATYNSATYYPSSNAWVVDEGFLAGENHIVTVAVMPISYNRRVAGGITTNRLKQSQTVRLTLSYELRDSLAMYPIIREDSTLRQEGYRLAQSMVVNPNNVAYNAPIDVTLDTLGMIIPNSGDGLNGGGLDPGTGISPDDPVDPNPLEINNYPYLVITTSDLSHSLRRLEALKKQKGFNVKMMTLEQVLSHPKSGLGDMVNNALTFTDDAGKLRQFLRFAYKYWGTRYVYLVGDSVPYRYISVQYKQDEEPQNVPSDLYFSDLTSDWSDSLSYKDRAPELYVGRLLANSGQQVKNNSDKLMRYELNPGYGDRNYLQRAFFLEGREFNHYLNSPRDSLVVFYPNQIIIRDSVETANPIKGKDVIDTISSNPVGLISIVNHGSPNSIMVYGKPYNSHQNYYLYANSDITVGNGLNCMRNKYYPTIFYALCCKTMPFDYNGINCGKSFTIGEDYGGPVYIGYTRTAHGLTQLELFKKFAGRLRIGFYKLGEAFALSKVDTSGFIAYCHAFINGYLGDPSLELWTALPQEYSNIIITRSNSSITVSGIGVDSTMVTICGNGSGNFQTKTLFANSSVTFNNVSPNSSVMLHKHNMIPYIAPLVMQNVDLNHSQYVIASDVIAGKTVDSGRTNGNVTVKNGIEYEIEASGVVTLEGGFNVEKGATFAVYPSCF